MPLFIYCTSIFILFYYNKFKLQKINRAINTLPFTYLLINPYTLYHLQIIYIRVIANCGNVRAEHKSFFRCEKMFHYALMFSAEHEDMRNSIDVSLIYDLLGHINDKLWTL